LPTFALTWSCSQAEILVMTDGFGPVPRDLRERLGSIKLHIILIPDLDIEKILQMYPDRASWKKGGHDGCGPCRRSGAITAQRLRPPQSRTMNC
jgi:hypothetical protein